MESADPFTRDFHPLDNARAEHTTTKRDEPHIIAIHPFFLTLKKWATHSQSQGIVYPRTISPEPVIALVRGNVVP